MSKACKPCCDASGEKVQLMTHTKLGAVHILTLKADMEGAVPAMFKATDDYAVSDSFLVNGEGYTPITQDGTALRAQFFKAGGVVNVAVDTVTKRLGFPIGTAGTGKVPVEAAGKLLMGDEKGNIVSSGKTADEIGAVKSVFGRTGEVVAQAGDYTAEMVGAADVATQQVANRLYPGVDLTVKFASEIAATPYNGNPWAWIQARIRAANYAGLNVGDYIPFVAGGNIIKAEIAGMDTYYNYGDVPVPHHIDFISRDCWPETHQFNKANYNNGTTVSPHPWLASDLYAWLNSLAMQVPNATTANPALVSVDYRTAGVYDKLPGELKEVIVSKRLLLPQRYTAGSLLTADNLSGWVDAGNLWIPSEIEVYGCEHWGSKNGYSSGGFQQYSIFTNNMKRIKGAGDGGSSTFWWLLSASGNYSANFTTVVATGTGGGGGAINSGYRAPLCFRIA